MALVYRPLTLTFQNPWIDSVRGMDILAKLIRHYGKDFKVIIFYPEESREGRFHFHGFIKYNRIKEPKYNLFIRNWKRNNGFTKVSYMKDKSKADEITWLMYCKKDSYIWDNMRITKYNYKNYLYKKPNQSRLVQTLITDYLNLKK